MRVNKYDEDELQTVKFNFQVFKRIFRYITPFKKIFIAIILLNIILMIVAAFTPKIIQIVIDNIIPNKDISKLFLYSGYFLALILIEVVLNKITNTMSIKINAGVVYHIRNDLFNHMQYLSSDFYDKRPHGKILVRITDYAQRVSSLITNYFFNVIYQVLNLGVILVFMFSMNAYVTCITLLGALALVIIFRFIAPRLKRLSKQQAENSGTANAFLLESVNGMSCIQMFNREKKSERSIEKIINDRININSTASKYHTVYWYATQNINQIVLGIIYLVGIWLLYPSITIGVIIAMGTYSMRFWGPIEFLTSVANELVEAIASIEKIFEIIDEPVIIRNSPHAIKKELDGSVEFKNVTFGYNTDKQILVDLSFRVLPKEKIALVGKTGIGKTTIINLISRFYDVSQGEILIDGIPIKQLNIQSLRSQIKVMLQDNYLFGTTIEDNIKYGRLDATLEEVKDVCKALHLDEFIESLKDGYNTKISSNGKELSTGQRQLVCLARTIISAPKILILDEATSNIDLKTEKYIQQGIDYLMKNRTCFIIAHRLSTIKDCDRIFFIDNRNIQEIGTHEQLMKKKGAYYQLYIKQTEV